MVLPGKPSVEELDMFGRIQMPYAKEFEAEPLRLRPELVLGERAQLGAPPAARGPGAGVLELELVLELVPGAAGAPRSHLAAGCGDAVFL